MMEFARQIRYMGIYATLCGEGGTNATVYLLLLLAGCIAAYLLGSLNFGVIISRLAYRDDVRKHGSGNGGMTNMLRTYGKAPAVLTLVCDAAKAVLSILLFGRLFGGALGATVAGLGCIVGHAFPLYIGLIKQKVFLEVDERGSEATAATAIGMWTGSVPRPEPPPLTLRLDRPFLYAIIDNATGTILFLGRIVTFQT